MPAATAILDRFLQHATIIQITGKSYRLRNGGKEEATAKPKGAARTDSEERSSNEKSAGLSSRNPDVHPPLSSEAEEKAAIKS